MGMLCVQNQTFIAIERVTGTFKANGIIGLAPIEGNISFVNQLKLQGKIKERIVSLNY